jgi:hypothetical protein
MFERDGEDPDQEIRNPEIDLSFCVEMQTLEQRDIRRDADSERGQENMPPEDPGELETRERDRVKRHSDLTRCLRVPSARNAA